MKKEIRKIHMQKKIIYTKNKDFFFLKEICQFITK
jgi:hypothetical protein